jgi:mitogen-activated protein kinase kinase kinase
MAGNNITGENLMEMDQATLKEMGVNKVGDRVRIGAQAKQFRNNIYRRTSKRTVNRHSLAVLDSNAQQPVSVTTSPRALYSTRSNTTSRVDKRMSRRIDGTEVAYNTLSGKTTSRPNSPLVDQENWARAQRYAGLSPMENRKKEQSPSYFGQPSKSRETPQTARFAGHVKSSPSVDNLHTYSTCRQTRPSSESSTTRARRR